MVWAVDLVRGLSQDAQCLASILLRGNGGSKSHKERLDFFYGPQAHACESVGIELWLGMWD